MQRIKTPWEIERKLLIKTEEKSEGVTLERALKKRVRAGRLRASKMREGNLMVPARWNRRRRSWKKCGRTFRTVR